MKSTAAGVYLSRELVAGNSLPGEQGRVVQTAFGDHDAVDARLAYAVCRVLGVHDVAICEYGDGNGLFDRLYLFPVCEAGVLGLEGG